MAKINTSYKGPEYDIHLGHQENEDRFDRWLTELKAHLREKDTGALVGEVIRWPRGDGYAQYVVVKEKPLTLGHLDIMDGWEVERELIRGLRIGDVRAMVKQARALREIFGRAQ